MWSGEDGIFLSAGVETACLKSCHPYGVPRCWARSPIGTADIRQAVQRSGTPAEMKWNDNVKKPHRGERKIQINACRSYVLCYFCSVNKRNSNHKIKSKDKAKEL